ncbi:hypothetical protein FP2506_04861 [Fulvimarina pelagi HTCC2506]|uniref:Uncharacterized protein n=1 Tax=Fulvimarina pelagi HTCC2506 TaxID=314231 RepID=Q0FZR0_9HYPH|nr:hypothetical protein FP2506_04861 [Fulvimarina pelagi HTCC2506]
MLSGDAFPTDMTAFSEFHQTVERVGMEGFIEDRPFYLN